MREIGEPTEYAPHKAPMPEREVEQSRRERLFGGARSEIPRDGARLERYPEVADRLKAGIETTRTGIDRWAPQDRARAEHWFGSSSPEVREHLAGVFERIDSAKNQVDLKPFPDSWSPEERDLTYGVVWPNQHAEGARYDVHVGRLYNEANGPPDSRAGIIVHELSHFHDIGDTGDADDDYGRDGATRVAERSTQEALRTGDNIEYFYEDYEREARRAR